MADERNMLMEQPRPYRQQAQQTPIPQQDAPNSGEGWQNPFGWPHDLWETFQQRWGHLERLHPDAYDTMRRREEHMHRYRKMRPDKYPDEMDWPSQAPNCPARTPPTV